MNVVVHDKSRDRFHGGGIMWAIFGKTPKNSQALETKACRITWHYEHPPEVLAFDREADPRAFALWVPTVGDAEVITRRQLVSLYAEFCEIHEVRPLSWGRFDRSLKPSGFQRYRLSTPGRPWVYRIARPGSAIVYKMAPRLDAPRANARARRAA